MRKLSVRFCIALAAVLLAIACSRPDEQPAPATSATSATPATPATPETPTTSATPVQPPSPAPAPAPAAPEKSSKPAAPAPEVLRIPAGTTLAVTMIDPVGTDTSQVGDRFTASIASPVVVNGRTVLAKGTKVQGRVESVDEPGRVKGKASISLVLIQVMGRNKTYAIATQPFTAQADAGTKKDAVKVGGGAAIGALVGAIAGGKKGAAIGAAVGGGAGTTAVLATKGEQLRIDSETAVNFVLKQDVEIEISKSIS